jgi:histidinol-phosphate aminotransferase
MKELGKLVRLEIQKLAPYSCARNEYEGTARVMLDANENPFNAPYNRYPDPLQRSLKQKISEIKGILPENIFLGNGSDEAIDLCFRIFCRPGIDNVVAIEPTYGMYRVAADINAVEYRTVDLEADFALSAQKLLASTDVNTKIIFLCSPNNPTGNLLAPDEIRTVLKSFDGIVVVDEAYSDFSRQRPFRLELAEWENMIVLNTFSKAWGCAGIRLGMAFAHRDIIEYFNKVKYPYNISQPTMREAERQLSCRADVDRWVAVIVEERARLMQAVGELPFCTKIWHTDANFFLARFTAAQHLYDYLVANGVIVRNRSSVHLCGDCLRITVGSPAENTELLSAMRHYNYK